MDPNNDEAKGGGGGGGGPGLEAICTSWSGSPWSVRRRISDGVFFNIFYVNKIHKIYLDYLDKLEAQFSNNTSTKILLTDLQEIEFLENVSSKPKL